MPLAAGSRIGVYQILNPIGRGGMGEVYRARDTRLDRTVALKTLPTELSRDPDRRERFEREARLTSNLNHPNIVVVYDIGEQEGLSYIAMEFVEGETLSSMLRRGPLGAQLATDLASQIADGLARAHLAGVIHRDLKPSNIMVTPERRAKILDFGLGKLLASDAQATDETVLGSPGPPTTPGVLLGTAAYMAPEQAQGRFADVRSDQFALGLILYEMLTGKHPFGRASGVQTLTAIIQDEAPPIAQTAPRTPEALALIVERCLAKSPADRFESTADLARALQEVSDHLRSGRVLAPVSDVRRRRPTWVAALTAATLAVGGLLGWQYFRATSSVLPAVKQVAVLPFVNVGGEPSSQALSDGLAEVLTTRLTQLERFAGTLRVVPATEVRQQQIASARDAHRAFGVNLVVSGSLQRISDRIRLTLNVSDPESLRQVKADTLELALQDASALQDEVLLRLARLLEIDLAPEARSMLSAGATHAPGASEFYLQGRGYLQRFERADNLDTALQLFERAITLDPEYGLGYAALAEASWRKYEATKDGAWIDRATAAARSALRLGPTLSQVRVTLGLIAIGTGRYEEAVRELTSVLSQDPSNADAYRELGRAYDALGDTPKAEATLKTAVSARPGDWLAYNSLGAFYFRHQQYTDAAAQFERVVALTPDNARGYSNLGSVYATLRQWDRAFPALERATALGPTGERFSNLGTAYFRQSRFADAAKAFERAIELGTRNYQVWFNLASAYQFVPGSESKGQAAFHRAAELAEQERLVNPRQAILLARLADCYAHLGDKEKSRRLIGEAEELAPKDARVFLLAAQVFEQLGDRKQALQRVAGALERGLPREDVETNRSLDSLRADPAYAMTRK
jgi:tetratricopeptide (TPR) repeat protein/predicted Ser/Thr protein kinase